MGITAEAPSSPDLTNRPLPSAIDPDDVADITNDLRREELETALAAGAWEDGFAEWADYTGLNDPEFRAIRDAGLVEELDFYWDPYDGGVEYELPPIPETLSGERSLARQAESELGDLADTVRKVLETDYISWDEPEIDEELDEER